MRIGERQRPNERSAVEEDVTPSHERFAEAAEEERDEDNVEDATAPPHGAEPVGRAQRVYAESVGFAYEDVEYAR